MHLSEISQSFFSETLQLAKFCSSLVNNITVIFNAIFFNSSTCKRLPLIEPQFFTVSGICVECLVLSLNLDTGVKLDILWRLLRLESLVHPGRAQFPDSRLPEDEDDQDRRRQRDQRRHHPDDELERMDHSY